MRGFLKPARGGRERHLVEKPVLRLARRSEDLCVFGERRQANEQAIDRLKACTESGHWPTGYEEPRLFDYL